MTWLAFIFALEVGFQSDTALMYFTPDFTELEAGYEINSPYVTLEAAAELFKVIRLGGSSQVYFADVYGFAYAPYDARFLFFTLITYAGFTFGWEHLCVHPVLSLDRPDVGFTGGGGDRIYLRYEAKIGGK